MELSKVESCVSRLKAHAGDQNEMECLESVIDLINKQKPSVPIVSRKGELICPTCGQPLHPTMWCDCGQLIDWSKDEVTLPTDIVKIKGVA